MVHALLEAHRVIKPEGLLIDVRPASVHRRVGLAHGDCYRLRWVMRENFEDDRAADRAVAQVISEGWFNAETHVRINCYRVMDTLGDFQGWLTDFVDKGKFPSHDWLVRRLEHALAAEKGNVRVVVSAPLVLRTLRKREMRQPLNAKLI
jgi:hypothetical protein